MEPRTIHIQCILLYHILVVHTCRHIISVTCKIWTRVFTGFIGLCLRGFAFMHHIFNIYSTQNQKLNAWQYVSASWFDECDPGVSGCQSLHGSGAVKPNTFKSIRYAIQSQSTFACFDAICTHFNAHMITFCHRSLLYGISIDLYSHHDPDFLSDEVALAKHVVQNHTLEQTLARYVCIWPSIRYCDIDSFINYDSGFVFIPTGRYEKREGIWYVIWWPSQ